MTEYTVPPAPSGSPLTQWLNQAEVALKRAHQASSTGEIFFHTGTPSEALLCDGRAVERVVYECLFDAIGTTFGAGDGSTTFNLPSVASLNVSNGTDAPAWIRT